MRSRRVFLGLVFAVAAVPGLVMGVTPSRCYRDTARTETCCAAASASHGEGCECCCEGPHRQSDRVQPGGSCGCVHQQQTPVEPTRSTEAAGLEHSMADALPAAALGDQPGATRLHRVAARNAPPIAAPALFLLDCAFLT